MLTPELLRHLSDPRVPVEDRARLLRILLIERKVRRRWRREKNAALTGAFSARDKS